VPHQVFVCVAQGRPCRRLQPASVAGAARTTPCSEPAVIAMHPIGFCDKRGAVTTELSEAPNELLLEESQDPAGLILKLAALGGSSFLK
jgi:hypothetical protein